MNTNIITAEYGHVTNVTFKNKFGWEESYFIVKVKKDNDFDLIYYLDNLIDKFNEMPAKDFKLAAIYHKKSKCIYYYDNDISYIVKDFKTISIRDYFKEMKVRLYNRLSDCSEKNRESLLEEIEKNRDDFTNIYGIIAAISLYINQPCLTTRPQIVWEEFEPLIFVDMEIFDGCKIYAAIEEPDEYISTKFNEYQDYMHRAMVSVTYRSNEMWNAYQRIQADRI